MRTLGNLLLLWCGASALVGLIVGPWLRRQDEPQGRDEGWYP